MIEAVSRIGDYVQKTEGGEDLLSTFIEDPNSKGNYKFVLIVVLNETDGEYSFNRVVFDEFSNYPRYLYKKGPANGTDVTPTCKIAGNLRKTFQNRFLKWFQNYDSYSISKEEKEILRRMNVAIRDQTEKILADLEEKFSQKKSNDNAIITLGIERDEEIFYPRDLQVFRNILLKKGSEIFSNKYGGESKGDDALCSVCKEMKDEVYGFAIPWSFHTFGKPGFIAGGFNFSESWKNTPVCFNCAIRLLLGKKYVEENLEFGFYGFRYLLVPKLAFGGDDNETLKEVLSILGDKDQKGR